MFEKKGILNCGQFYTVCCVLMFEKEGILNFDLYTCYCCCVNYCKFLKASFDILEREESVLFLYKVDFLHVHKRH